MQCYICKQEAGIQCCEKEFCSGCIGIHMMQITSSRHRPVQSVEKASNSLFLHIQSCLNNELLELEEFKSYCLQFISSFFSSVQSQVSQVCQAYQEQVLAKCQLFENSLKQSLSHLIIHQSTPVLELFKDCQSAEDVKKVRILQKSINCEEATFEDFLSDSISFRLDLDMNETGCGVDQLTEFKNPRTLSYSNTVKWHQFPLPFQPIVYNFLPDCSRVEFCNIREGSFAELKIDGEVFPAMAAWTVSQDAKLILTGGFTEVARRENFVYNIFEKKTEKIPKMIVGRFNHAQLQAGSYIYVIGGSNGTPLKDCERFNLQRREWTVFAKLVVAREYPAACFVEGNIYVCGGAGVESIECCNVKKPGFRLLNVRLPGPGKCCMFTYDTSVFVLQKGKVFQFLRKEMKLEIKTEFIELEIWSSCEPVVRYLQAAWSSAGKILMFELGNYSLKVLSTAANY